MRFRLSPLIAGPLLIGAFTVGYLVVKTVGATVAIIGAVVAVVSLFIGLRLGRRLVRKINASGSIGTIRSGRRLTRL
jgi:small neutral amino acid transporter SnatA (MarC family)